VILSHILGFLQERTVAHQVGSNAASDAFYSAFTLPDFLNDVPGASLRVIFIPVFTKYAAEGKEEEGWHVFSTVVTFMALLMLFFVTATEVFAPRLVEITSPGFLPWEKARVVFLTRLHGPGQHHGGCAILQAPMSGPLRSPRWSTRRVWYSLAGRQRALSA